MTTGRINQVATLQSHEQHRPTHATRHRDQGKVSVPFLTILHVPSFGWVRLSASTFHSAGHMIVHGSLANITQCVFAYAICMLLMISSIDQVDCSTISLERITKYVVCIPVIKNSYVPRCSSVCFSAPDYVMKDTGSANHCNSNTMKRTPSNDHGLLVPGFPQSMRYLTIQQHPPHGSIE